MSNEFFGGLFFFLIIRRPPRSTQSRSSAASDVYKRQRLSTYRRFEIILVNNGSEEPRTQRYLWHLDGRRHVSVVDCPGPFNFSRLCNEGARRATGDHVLFLNNDTEVLTPDWLERLLLIERH